MSEPTALQGREHLLGALQDLQTELVSNVQWENDTLPRYLDALCALLWSIENTYSNTGRCVPADPWEIMADAVRGARYYE